MKKLRMSQFSVNMPVPLLDRLDEFCERTKRDRATVIRTVLELFMRHGFSEAEKRLLGGSFELDAIQEVAEEHVAEIVRSVQDERKRRTQKHAS